jgi:phosphoserine phosphatase
MDSVLVVIAAPGSGAITEALVGHLGDVRWLAQGEALECDARETEKVRRICADLPLDINVVPVHNRRKRVLVADMDSTMIQQECIDELGDAAGLGEKIKDITARSMRGEIDFHGALRERVSLLKGLPATIIAKLLRERISFTPGGSTLLATMKANGAYCALLSGGFTAFTGPIAETLGFHEHQGNTLVIEDGLLSGTVGHPILGKDAKVTHLKRICAELNVQPDDVVAVGDGANDIPMLQMAGMGVALHAKPKVQEQSRFVINHGDLTSLLYLQGYRREELVAL